ncbi:MAG: hypothetical protein LBC98_03325 [Prevotellaceae bacterium]|jgi:hypothetical protein|nr:hypothetical protein [Prevotellaceae bacterium]
MKSIKEWPLNYKIFAAIAIISILGIILRWPHIKREAAQSFRYFGSDTTDTLKIK